MIEQLAGTVALITSCVGLLPQVYKTMKTRSAGDISELMLLNYVICSLAWIIYGMETTSGFVLASNVVGLLSALILMVQKKRYDA